MTIALVTSLDSNNWDLDRGRAAGLRKIFNVYFKFPSKNPNPFANKKLVFDENANLI